MKFLLLPYYPFRLLGEKATNGSPNRRRDSGESPFVDASTTWLRGAHDRGAWMRKIEVVCGRADVCGKLIMGATAPTAFRTLSVAGILCYGLRPFGSARELGHYNLGLFNFRIGFFLVLIIFAFMCV
ncbi:hypothetical protein ES319_A08G222700v1 [Gossypium barbadense]|uniref:Uncharacterized protein n=1 Tax=Gossypium barbadense TaxID=3634 RepID=A0A5J5UVD0_GOSBA|nr:hypothetical protein ES319_A08G222700v1 [Gossypium barbadense]